MECGAVGGFSEEQFREACAEIQQRAPAGANWELLVETLGFSIYGLLDQTGLYEYKVFGVLDDCPPALLADVYMDLDYRKQWDQYVKELYEKECNGETVVYWEVKYPFPMSNRDYIYIRQRQELDVEGRKIHVVLAQSTSVPQFAERPGVIRVNRYKQSLAIESDGKKGSKVFMYYFDNPGGQIPSWLINWVAKNGVPNFLKDMAKACQNYLKKT
ncbi:phosphatidylcholine transfer protein isoform X2 [Panthera pardus]|uniref:Phosphatidylcholine transfer protein n=1 Tax=Panthera pardus TaxID=9691 RepID=A0A9V1E055_PANPR|nr:phosphatidylcholine transfer protein isoform X2 [Panthera pardus]XP_042772509.1 phosphatidylcholine transfer protein isoform X2 [Panthera leo]XP_042823153.1 phosphatidylcholine transfer protein isoform X2 [Panthera tigris]XP_060502456.1 phosphatidylcholine transfer protein isoform X4 [Panthera onca]